MESTDFIQARIYGKYIKRLLDFTLSLCALIVLSPILLILSILGVILMKGNPFFIQERPGRNEVIFKLIKFRTMSNARNKNGELLSDAERLNSYGKFLRSTSLDELPELWNILKGDLSIVGPRPLLIEYLPYYTMEEKHRHDVRPGLTGLAQVNGRNAITWEKKLEYDLEYIKSITFINDIKIISQTVKKVLLRADIMVDTEQSEGNLARIRQAAVDHSISILKFEEFTEEEIAVTNQKEIIGEDITYEYIDS